MKTLKIVSALLFLGVFSSMEAQQVRVQSEARIENRSDRYTYYEQRAAEDANYELSFRAKTKAEEKAFWKDQKEYEKQLKKRDRKAYQAYIDSKKEVYSNHYSHCDADCHHSDAFYGYAGYYYYDYYPRRSMNTSTNTSINTQIGVRTPSVRLGL